VEEKEEEEEEDKKEKKEEEEEEEEEKKIEKGDAQEHNTLCRKLIHTHRGEGRGREK
jgi:hypothetical protein